MKNAGVVGARTHYPGMFLGAVVICFLLVMGGCRKQHAPQPLAPQRRGPVSDLAAIRGGEQLWLTWTVPRKGTGKLTVNGKVTVRVCRRESLTSACTVTGELQHLVPGTTGSFSEKLPPELASGPPRPLYYFVELMDRSGHSTGLSNRLPTLAGEAPPMVRDLSAEQTANGVLLHWMPASPQGEPVGISIRLHRTQLILTPATQAMRDGSVPLQQPDEREWVIDRDLRAGRALDADIRRGETYEYRVQRIFHLTVDGQALDLAGPFSNPVQVNTAAMNSPFFSGSHGECLFAHR